MYLLLTLFSLSILISWNRGHCRDKDNKNKNKRDTNEITIISWNTNGVIQNYYNFASRFSQGLNHSFFKKEHDQENVILCLQEIFRGPVKTIAMQELQKHGFTVLHQDLAINNKLKYTLGVKELSGLVNASLGNQDLLVVDKGLHIFKDRTSFDILAQKGFYHSVTSNGVHIINLHLQSILREYHVYDTYCFSRISVYQRKQLKQLFQYIRSNFTSTDKIVIVGDFNINPYFDYVNGLYLSCQMSLLGFTMRGYDMYNYKNKNTYDCRFLDHVWYRNLKIKKTVQAFPELLQFSDHLPVKTLFSF